LTVNTVEDQYEFGSPVQQSLQIDHEGADALTPAIHSLDIAILTIDV